MNIIRITLNCSDLLGSNYNQPDRSNVTVAKEYFWSVKDLVQDVAVDIKYK